MTDAITITPPGNSTVCVDSQTGFSAWPLAKEGGRRVYLYVGNNDVGLFPSEALKIAQALIEHAGSAATPANLFGEDAEDERAGWNLDALNAATEYGREAEFTYQAPGDPQTRRVIQVEGVDTTRQGHTVVTGYDKTKGEPRVFRLDRIVGFVTVR